MKKEITVICLFCAIAIAFFAWNKPQENIFKSFEKEFESEEYESEEEEEAKQDQPSKYFEFHRGIRTRDGAESPEYKPGHLAKEIKKGLAEARMRKSSRAAGIPPSNGVTAWTERGPANVPGRTRALLNLPGDANNNSWLAGAATGGVWKTIDGGATWTERSGTAQFPVFPISSFAMSGSVIYAGTGEYVSTRLTAVGDGIFKSTDNGDTWTQVASTAANEKFAIVTRVITDPSDPNIILASTVRSFWSTVSNQTSIMRSINGGTSWTEVYTTNGAVEQIIATPGNFQVQYASLNGVGVLKSIDGGVTWNLSNTGMTPGGRGEIGVSPHNPNKVYVSTEGNVSGSGGSDLYVSSDAGASWSVVDVRFNSLAVDFLLGQGFYDNTIMCDPFNENIVYFGGVSLFRSTLTGGAGTAVDDYKILEDGTDFIFLQSFTSGQWDNQRLNAGAEANIKKTVEVRFGPGRTQKAHRFEVPAGSTSGVPVNNYTYKDYIDVPFEVWDITAEPDRQLMVSFRDQAPNGVFDLVTQFLEASPAANNSREYLYIHNADYSTTSSPNIGIAGGQEFNKMYNIFPCLAAGETWDPNNLPTSTLTIKYSIIPKVSATTVTVADSRPGPSGPMFDGKNPGNQIDLHLGLHPDHHYMIPIVMNETTKTYKILLGNDGGPFISNVSTTPGIANGDWTWKGNGYITSQFYGADKRPGMDQYIGGMQDNGTRVSQVGQAASKTTPYNYAIGGDGFEVLWHSLDGLKVIGSLYYNRFFRSTNGGSTWAEGSFSSNENLHPFFSRLANSKNFPDRIFAIGIDGVWRSQNFGTNWTKTEITTQWTNNPSFLDVEVSAANANIVWAGAAITADSRLHVSTDGGVTFTATNNYSENMGVISKLGSHPTQPNTAYALFSPANTPKILRTTDLGQNWEDISGFGTNDDSSTGFPDVAVFCIYVRPDNPNIIWVGTEIGIVESMNNGASWALLEDFPNVAVWDMKGQDDQVVIATHGRGIWTATIEASQHAVKNPEITQFGTSPKEELMLRVIMEETFDSVVFYNSTTRIGRVTNVTPSEMTVKIKNLAPGTKNIKTISYKGTAPFTSLSTNVDQLDILSVENTYTTYFRSAGDLTANGFSLAATPGEGPGRVSMQSTHTYPHNSDLRFLLRHPVKVSPTLSTLWYRDIAIVEPSDIGAVFGTPEFKDYVILEASKNGLDWTPLLDGYNARSQPQWLTAFNASQTGNMDMYVTHEVDLRDTFTAGDTLLVRYRLSSNASIAGWGAAVIMVSIQEEPTGLESYGKSIQKLSTFPNPSTGNFTAEYELKQASEVTVTIMDAQGKRILEKALGRKESGVHRDPISIANGQGSYLVIVKTNRGREISKMVIKK